MKRPRLLVSEAAASDILEQAEWYATQSGQKLAKRWEKAVRIRHPAHSQASNDWSAVRVPIPATQEFETHPYCWIS